ncbi:porphobilinogen deaminase, dipyromethane cofactor binding domain-containing protein [Thelephora terrestris]|uniref:Porphobilinogen deaminase n=1 Tax=Thelephora terrestris TaxID=56493 RepID=A0A9P6HF29_9AGAM|nr:porphobilinogen deaminase, dipyromethane cofactor binding domain-containing protein [Thelephora terrestris]
MSGGRTFTLASRPSKLAVVQTELVLTALQNQHPHIDLKTRYISSAGDKNQTDALYLMGGKSVWTEELEAALIDGSVDLVVHSLKDVPTTLPAGMEIGAILEREDPVDGLVMKDSLPFKTLGDLPDGSVIGTSSLRRVAQLRRAHPRLKYIDVRGNIDTRLRKLDDPHGPYTAIILAKAGMLRMTMESRLTSDLSPPILYHAVGQGALAVEIRSSDSDARELCKSLSHRETLWKCSAERAMLRELEGGCSVPVGVQSELVEGEDGVDVLTLVGCVTSVDGVAHVQEMLEERVSSLSEAEEIGKKLAKALLENGASSILEGIKKLKDTR